MIQPLEGKVAFCTILPAKNTHARQVDENPKKKDTAFAYVTVFSKFSAFLASSLLALLQSRAWHEFFELLHAFSIGEVYLRPIKEVKYRKEEQQHNLQSTPSKTNDVGCY